MRKSREVARGAGDGFRGVKRSSRLGNRRQEGAGSDGAGDRRHRRARPSYELRVNDAAYATPSYGGVKRARLLSFACG